MPKGPTRRQAGRARADVALVDGGCPRRSGGAHVAARQSQKRYLPTAYIAERLPAGSKSLERVPSLAAGTVEDELERLQAYVTSIRATARVFATFHHTGLALAEHATYMVWIGTWCELSGFGSFVAVDSMVRYMLARTQRRARDVGGL